MNREKNIIGASMEVSGSKTNRFKGQNS